MATVVRDIPYHDRRIAERRRIAYPAALRADGVRVSWGGVFGGVLVALGFLLLMTALGVAVGISAAQPGETDTGTLGAGLQRLRLPCSGFEHGSLFTQTLVQP